MKKPETPAPSLLTRLARENKQMGIRLAQLEFREMQAELNSSSIFDLKIDFPPVEQFASPSISASSREFQTANLPVLNVPLGKIAWTTDPDRLPALGIYCPDIDFDALRLAFADLMASRDRKRGKKPFPLRSTASISFRL